MVGFRGRPHCLALTSMLSLCHSEYREGVYVLHSQTGSPRIVTVTRFFDGRGLRIPESLTQYVYVGTSNGDLLLPLPILPGHLLHVKETSTPSRSDALPVDVD